MPTHTTVNAEGNMWLYHGLPHLVQNNCGPQFVVDFTCELYRLLGIKLATSMEYHPQMDGQTKCVNQEME